MERNGVEKEDWRGDQVRCGLCAGVKLQRRVERVANEEDEAKYEEDLLDNLTFSYIFFP